VREIAVYLSTLSTSTKFRHPEDAESKFFTNDEKTTIYETCFMPILVKHLCLKSSE
jgi:hypothetical protein